MLNGITKTERIKRSLQEMKNSGGSLDILSSLAEIALKKMSEKEIKNWWELEEDMSNKA